MAKAPTHQGPTWAQIFRDAVWEADPDQLSSTEALVLLAYADHLKGGDTAWVAQSRLIQRCKFGSKGTPSRVLATLVAKGWMELLSPAQWANKQSPRYRLRIPTAPMSGAVEAVEPPRSETKAPRSETKAPRSVAQTAPLIGAKLPADEYRPSIEGPSRPSIGESAPRTATPRGALPEDEDPSDSVEPLANAREVALALAAAAKRRDVVISRWPTKPPADPNPDYDRGVAALAAIAVAGQWQPAGDEPTEEP
ncbi:hypothetical protein O7635_27840 [Asanoa sp. WMMD1127]|uniref:hypothetical protein n=1 Tax=Asanoa sp. WMMD1127 TaxID=3016107 RepID=UPI002417D07E|nr:hypothetical protein [Asanoa sp. WMMD1127]MDG4825675.1 hypothetical protein [Asanoa sp. WMMD1127]